MLIFLFWVLSLPCSFPSFYLVYRYPNTFELYQTNEKRLVCEGLFEKRPTLLKSSTTMLQYIFCIKVLKFGLKIDSPTTDYVLTQPSRSPSPCRVFSAWPWLTQLSSRSTRHACVTSGKYVLLCIFHIFLCLWHSPSCSGKHTLLAVMCKCLFVYHIV